MKKTVQIFSLTALLAASMLSAQDGMDCDLFQSNNEQAASLEQPADQPRAECTRPFSKKEKREAQIKRAKQAKALKQKMKNARCMGLSAKSGSYMNQDTMHYIHDRSNQGDTVEIENGAVFSIRSCDTGVVSQWQKHHNIRIRPNHTWFSSYQYSIYNQNTGSTAEARLSMGPFLNSPYTRRIVQISPASSTIVLDNNSVWRVSDAQTLLKWQVNDKVILGDNPGWFTWGYDCIVINVTTDNYLTAQRAY